MRLKEHVLVLFIFLLLTLVLTYPLVTKFGTDLGGDLGDGWQNLWNMWWMKKSLLELHQNPYFTDFLHNPNGITLIFQTMNPFNGIISIPLQIFFSLIAVYNIVLILSFVLSGFGMYLLLMHLTKNRFASFFGGAIFTFAPYHFGQALGHLQEVSFEFLPFYILFFLKTHENFNIKNVLFAGLFLFLNAMTSWYYLMFALMFSGFYIIYFGFTEKRVFFGLIKRTAPIFLIAFIALSPIFAQMITESAKYKFAGAHNPNEWSADIVSFFVPGKIQTIGKFFESIRPKVDTSENSIYLGYAVLGLSAFAFLRLRKKNKLLGFFAITNLIFFILALGTFLRIGGNALPIPLPYLLLYRYVPVFFSFTGVPVRFASMVVLGLSVMAAFGLKELLAMQNRHRRNFVVLGLTALLFVEFLAIPFTTSYILVPDFYKELSSDKEDYAVMDLHITVQRLYYQTIHEKRIVGGFVSRHTKDSLDFLENASVISDILYNKKAKLRLRVNNKDNRTWNSEGTEVALSYHLYDKDMKMVKWDNKRIEIGILEPGESTLIDWELIPATPHIPGETVVSDVAEKIKEGVIVEFDLVSEGNYWFAEREYPALLLNISKSGIVNVIKKSELRKRNDQIELERIVPWNGTQARDVLNGYNIRYVIVPKVLNNNLPGIYGFNKAFEDEQIISYDVRNN